MSAFGARHAAMHAALKDKGKYPHQVTIETNVGTVDDGYGHAVESWSEFLTTNASIVSTAVSEDNSRQQVQVDYTYVICFDYVAGITETMRVKFGTRIFEIKDVIDLRQRNIELELHCIEVS